MLDQTITYCTPYKLITQFLYKLSKYVQVCTKYKYVTTYTPGTEFNATLINSVFIQHFSKMKKIKLLLIRLKPRIKRKCPLHFLFVFKESKKKASRTVLTMQVDWTTFLMVLLCKGHCPKAFSWDKSSCRKTWATLVINHYKQLKFCQSGMLRCSTEQRNFEIRKPGSC